MKPPRIVPFAEAYVLAKHASQVLAPHVVRMKAVGSIRRRREFVGDLEFLVEPRMSAIDLFGKLAPELEALKGALLCLGTWVKGGTRQMVITDFNGREGLKLELYIVHPPAQWGSLLAIRTGPWELSREAVSKMRALGRRHVDGHVLNAGGETIPTPGEEDFFAAAGLPCLPPRARDQCLRQPAADQRAPFVQVVGPHGATAPTSRRSSICCAGADPSATSGAGFTCSKDSKGSREPDSEGF